VRRKRLLGSNAEIAIRKVGEKVAGGVKGAERKGAASEQAGLVRRLAGAIKTAVRQRKRLRKD
jgi:hypothetical protein